MITGLSFATGLPQLARAALESVAFQVEDVVAAVEIAGPPIHTLLADGGASANPVLMQLQADLSGRAVHAATDADLSPLGAAHLAGRAIGIWSDNDLESLPRPRRCHFCPAGPAGREQAGEGAGHCRRHNLRTQPCNRRACRDGTPVRSRLVAFRSPPDRYATDR
jgi:glycerol kinase